MECPRSRIFPKDVIKPCLSFSPTNGEACPYYQNQLCPCPVSKMHSVVLPRQCRGLLQNDSVYGSNEREQGLFRIHAQDDPGDWLMLAEEHLTRVRLAFESLRRREEERVSKKSTRNDLDYTLKPRTARNRAVFDPNGSFALAILLKNGTIQANQD
jgi:hypothetical protein